MNHPKHSIPAKRRGLAAEFEEHNVAFSLVFIGMFLATFIFLALVGATPDPQGTWEKEHGGTPVAESTPANTDTNASANTAPQGQGEEPVRIVIDSIGLRASVSNPSSTDVDVLDNALLTGAVRYPSSGLLGANGTVLLFGHSSYLPIVHNQAYKTFDGIQKLATGDEISIYSATKEYRYRVTGVRTANVNDNDTNTIALPQDGQHLTLITCDSFATKSDRFVVTADFEGAYTLAS